VGGCRIHRLLSGSGVVGVRDDLGQRLEIWVVAESVRETRLSRGKLIRWASHIDHDVVSRQRTEERRWASVGNQAVQATRARCWDMALWPLMLESNLNVFVSFPTVS